MKKSISLLLVLSIISGIFAVCGVTAFAKNNNLSCLDYKIENNEVTITKCATSIVGEFVIPDTIEGYPVTAIGAYAFDSCENLETLYIPATIKEIGESAFSFCMTLAEVHAESLDSWLSMELADYGASPTNNGASLYIGNELATEIVIPENITKINDFIFNFCTSVQNVILHENVTEIGAAAFEGCRTLKNINLPDSLRVIGAGAFRWCSALTEINIPYGITRIESDTFARCDSLTSVTIPDSVRWIGWFAFEECTALKELSLGNGITRISEEAFTGCVSLEKVVFPESLTDIMLFSFLACDSLTEIVIPETAKKFGLDEYTAVTDIYYTGSNSDWKNIAVTDESNALRNIRIHYNYETPAVDETPIPEHIYNNLVYRTENGNAIITRCTAEYPEEIVIPDTIDGYPVTEIQTDAFYGCTRLKKVTLPANLKKIGNSAFYMCEGLKEIVIPDGTEKIDEFAFFFCSNLTEITIPASVEYIGSDAIATSFGENPEGTQTTVFIYGQSGSAAETYAEEYNLVFVATEPDGSVDPNKLAVNDSSIKVDNKNMLSTFGPDQTTESLKKKIRNSDIEITDKDGNTYSADAFVGTGSKIRIMNNDGSIASEYTVIVPSDVDGNGEITASDARKALRTSAGLEDLTDVYKTAADSDSNDEITASDARKILRLSAGLE